MSDGEVGDVVDLDVLFSEVDGVLDDVAKPAMHVYPLPAANSLRSMPSRSTASTSATKKQGLVLRPADLGWFASALRKAAHSLRRRSRFRKVRDVPEYVNREEECRRIPGTMSSPLECRTAPSGDRRQDSPRT